MMSKMISGSEYAPLWPNGFKDITESELERVFVEPFGSGNNRRKELYRKFTEWLHAVKGIGIPVELWIDGSFATYKPEPADIDIVCIINVDDFQALEHEKMMRACELLSRDNIKKKYCCHVYSIYKNSKSYDYDGDYNYWKNQFGHSRNGMSKGIYRIF